MQFFGMNIGLAYSYDKTYYKYQYDDYKKSLNLGTTMIILVLVLAI